MYVEFDEDTDIHKVKKIFFGTEFWVLNVKTHTADRH